MSQWFKVNSSGYMLELRDDGFVSIWRIEKTGVSEEEAYDWLEEELRVSRDGDVPPVSVTRVA